MSDNRHSYTDSELVLRLQMLRQHKGNQASAAAAMNLSPSGFRESIKKAKLRKLTADSRVTSELDKWKTKAKVFEQQLAAIQRENITAAEIKQTIFKLAAETPDPPRWTLNLKAPKSSGVPCQHWSDWHYGERVSRDELDGANEYNRAIANKRIRKLVETSIDLAKNHMTMTKYPGGVICLGGDMITGDIHDDLRETNDGSVQEALYDLDGILIEAIEQNVKAFGKLLIPCVVGNHGRGTAKPRAKRHVVMSHEWGLYQRLARHFARDKRITFLVSDSSDMAFNVVGTKYMLTHGDRLGVKGGDGIIGVLGPMARGTVKMGRQQSFIGRGFDCLLAGHFHTRVPYGDAGAMMFNGSVIGPNEYSNNELRVPATRPSQNLWFTHPKYGITAQWPVYLEKRQQAAEYAPWVAWQQKRAA